MPSERSLEVVDNPTQIQRGDQVVATAVAQEVAHRRAAIVCAREFPRDIAVFERNLLVACRRPAFAEKARWKFPRGGKTLYGKSVNLAREGAKCYRNLDWDIEVPEMTDDQVVVWGVAWDQENNSRVRMQSRFGKLVQRKLTDKETGRKETAWVTPDERDLRELVNRHGAICVRNALLQILPTDIMDEAEKICGQTVLAFEKEKLKGGAKPADRWPSMVEKFKAVGVTESQLLTHLGHDPKGLVVEEIVEYLSIYQSINEGNSRPSDYFEFEIAPDAAVPPVADPRPVDFSAMFPSSDPAKKQDPA